MKYYILLLLSALLLAAQSVVAAQAENDVVETKPRRHAMKRDCDAPPDWCNSDGVTCKPEIRGQCGKRRGDWYGARKPVANEAEARTLLLNYFAGQGYTVSEITERRWGFRAEIINKDGKVVDRVMIDKRSGRIRSMY
ncbi:MAG: hypothetical protein HGB32_15820 [Geobacteraceae bacterium]|nr:hypothetical protein [Geobacteraceae bacterium]NTW81590.1 hypothetical protein [Geobacteraceae bacterium]